MLSLDRRRALGWWLLIAVLASLALYVHSVSYLIMDREGDALMAFMISTSMGFVAPVMPLVAALPFATAFCIDLSSAYSTAILPRLGVARYLRSKILACALSGGLATMLGMLSFITLLGLKFPQDFTQPFMFEALSGLESLLLDGGVRAYALYYLSRLAICFLSGAFWAMAALAFSAFYPNVPLTLCAPLVLYRLAAEVNNLIALPGWLNLTLLEEGMVDLSPALTLAAALAVFGGLIVILGFIFAWRAGRRLRYA